MRRSRLTYLRALACSVLATAVAGGACAQAPESAVEQPSADFSRTNPLRTVRPPQDPEQEGTAVMTSRERVQTVPALLPDKGSMTGGAAVTPGVRASVAPTTTPARGR